MYEERKTKPPSANCDSHDKPMPVPDGNADNLNEYRPLQVLAVNRVEDIHAKHNQQRSGSEGQVTQNLRKGNREDQRNPILRDGVTLDAQIGK